MSKEQIFLQFGPQANHAAAHLWSHEAALAGAGFGRKEESAFFRNSRGGREGEQLVPRAIVIDYQDAPAFQTNATRWGKKQRTDADQQSPSPVAASAGGSSSGDWATCMRGPSSGSGFAYAPQSCVPLGGRSTAGELFGSAAAAALTSSASFGAFPDGAALFDSESLLEPLRWQLEACDRLQGVVALADVGSGWGGLARAYLTAARDELLGHGPSAVLFGLLDEDDGDGGDDHHDGDEHHHHHHHHDGGGDDDDERWGGGSKPAGRGYAAGAGAGAGSGAGSASRRDGSSASAPASSSAGEADFGAAARERRTMRSLNAALALQAFAGGSVGSDESADAGCTFIPLGASFGGASGGSAAGGAGCGCGWAGMPQADTYASAISMMLDAGRSAEADSDGRHPMHHHDGTDASESWVAHEDYPAPAWAMAWDAPLETSGTPPLASIPSGASLADALRLLRDGSGSGLGLATLRLAALPGMPTSGSAGAGPGSSSSGSAGRIPAGMTASSLARWLPSPAVDPRARSSTAEAAAVAAAMDARMTPLSWAHLRGRMPSSFGAAAAVAACPAHVQAHFAVLRCAVTAATASSSRAAAAAAAGAGAGESGYGSGSGSGSSSAGPSLSLSMALGASAGGVARPALSTPAALSRALDGWMESWRCRAAAHRVVGSALPAATPLCMPGSARASASGASSSPSSASASSPSQVVTRAALLHASVGLDAARLLARAAGALGRLDRSRLHRFTEEGSTGSGAGLDVAGLTDALLTMAEAAAAGIPGSE